MGSSAKKKDSASDLTKDQKIKILAEWGRTRTLITQIRLAAANAYTESIFDQIVEVKGNTGTITSEQIISFLRKFYYYNSIYYGESSLLGDDLSGRYEILRFAGDFLGAFVISTILKRFNLLSDIAKFHLPDETDYILRLLNDGVPTETEDEETDYAEFISKGTDHISFDMHQSAIDELRQDLLFHEVLNNDWFYGFEQWSGFPPYENEDSNELDIPFKGLYKSCYDNFYKDTNCPYIPTLIFEILLNGIESYSAYFCLGAMYKKEKGKVVSNKGFSEIQDALNEVLDLLLDQAGD